MRASLFLWIECKNLVTILLMIKNAIVVSIVATFLALIVFGVVRQTLYGEIGNSQSVVPTYAATTTIPEIQATAVAAIPSSTPTTAVATEAATASPIAPQTHIVQAGETLFSIAQRYNISVDQLTTANGIFNPNLVQAGQELSIPGPANPGATGNSGGAPALVESTPATPPTSLNGIPVESIIVMPENVKQHMREIYALGQEIGRNPFAYSKVGDSTIQNPFFMARFEEPGGYFLGEYAYLQPAVDHFRGSHGREGMAVRKGFHSWTVNDPFWADNTVCQPNETPVICEIRTHNPSILLIRLGSNDSGVPEMFNDNVRVVVEIALANGIIPVIGTKADRFEGSNINNEILRQIAAEYQLPLWDFDTAAQMIPGRGLDIDNVHLTTFYAHDYSSPVALQRGHGVHNLTALMMLQTLLAEIIIPASSE